MGKIDTTDSPRRSSGRVRKPTYKLRGENGMTVNSSSLTDKPNADSRVGNPDSTNSQNNSRNKTSPEFSESSYSNNSKIIPKSQKYQSDLASHREELGTAFSDDNNISNGGKITPLSRKRSQTKAGLKTRKSKYKKSMNSDDTLSLELESPKLQFTGINEHKATTVEGKVTGTLDTVEAGNHTTVEAGNYTTVEAGNYTTVESGNHTTVAAETKIMMDVVDNSRPGSKQKHVSSPETDDNRTNINSMIGQNEGNASADAILVKVKTELGVAYTDKYTNTNFEGIEVDLKPSKAAYMDGIFHGLKTDGSANECEPLEDSSDMDVICKLCSKHFTSRHNLNKHMLLHADKKPFQCEVCGLSFALKNYLTTHKLVHTGVRSHKCDICGKQFLRRTNLNSHKKTHSDSRAYTCDICDKSFKTKFGLDCHRKSQHVGGFVCHTCGKSYSHQNYLRKHLSIHAGEKPFECTECGKCFPYNQSLQEHMRRHLGEKPEVCDQCGKRFNNKRELKHHSKYHQSTSGYACSECNVRYDTLQSLNKHMSKTHKKTHNCIHCNECFVNKKHLRSHVFRQHRDINTRRLSDMDLAKVKKVECSFCEKMFFNRYVLSKHLVSMHQLTEENVKTMLQIRKKTASKLVSGRILDDDINEDIANSLENDKSFQVYYKDEEMAVYVKRVDDFNGKIKHESRLKEKQLSGSLDDLDARYIVVEEDNTIGNELAEIDMCVANERNTEGVNNSAVVGMTMIAGDTNPELVSTECVTGEHGTEDSYVVIADHNEHSEELENRVLGEAEMFEISNNGSERIVLILNDGSGDGEVIFDGSEQYEIVESGMELAALGHDKEIVEMEMNGNSQGAANSYEIVANTPLISKEYAEVILGAVSNGNVTLTDGNNFSDRSVTVSNGNIISDGRVTVSNGNIISDGMVTVTDGNIISDGSVTVSNGNIIRDGSVTVSNGNIISDGRVTVSNGNIISDGRVAVTDGNIISDGRVAVTDGNIISDRTVTVTDGNIISDGTVTVTNGNIIKDITETHAEDHVPNHIQYVEAESLSMAEQRDYENLKHSFTKIDTDQSSEHGNSVENVAIETCESNLGIMPKNTSSEEFAKFENALKTKVVDFQDNTEYVAFLDKMIQSIQNAKHTPFQ